MTENKRNWKLTSHIIFKSSIKDKLKYLFRQVGTLGIGHSLAHDFIRVN